MSLTSVELVPPGNSASHLHVGRSKSQEHNQHVVRDAVLLQGDGGGDSKGRTALIIASITCTTGISSFVAGIVTLLVPVIAIDLQLKANLVLWPVSITALTTGCTLLISGSIADVVGGQPIYLLGCALQSVFTLACGLSNNGAQLIAFRALYGVATSFCLPSAVKIINDTFPPGQQRNIAFASMGGGQPVGFGIGLVLGGIFAGTIGWRWGFYIAAIINCILLILTVWQLPKNVKNASPMSWRHLASRVDWAGATIASSCLALLSYVLASITSSTSEIKSPTNISLLVLAFMLIPVFALWMSRQERLNRPALIPNTLWHNRIFTSICINVFLTWAAFYAFEQILNLFFQEVQSLSALQAALRFLPEPISGVLANITVGLIVHQVRADWIVVTTTLFSCISPLLMAIANPRWLYWTCAFPATFLLPIGADGLFTTSNLLITSVFPEKTQGLAGGVFNTIAQVGKSVGVALAALISNSVTAQSSLPDVQSPEALLQRYRATFWFCFAVWVTSLLVSVWGLRKIGKVGQKQE